MIAAAQTQRLVRTARFPAALPAARRVALVRPVAAAAAEDSAPARMATTKLYVGNLSWDTKAEDLTSLFSKYAEIEDAFVASDRETGRSRGFGFVTLDSGAAKDAIAQTDGTDFMGRTIRVNEAQPREGGGGRGGGRGYGGGGRGYGGGGGDRGYGGDRGGGDRYQERGERSYGGGRGGGRGYGGGGGGRGGGGRRDYGGDSYGGGGGGGY